MTVCDKCGKKNDYEEGELVTKHTVDYKYADKSLLKFEADLCCECALVLKDELINIFDGNFKGE